MMTEIIPEYVHFMPNDLSPGILYISYEFKLAIHLCACGCGGKTVTPLGEEGGDHWTITKVEEKVTLRPSIGNWLGENPYHAHYLITENKIEWCK